MMAMVTAVVEPHVQVNGSTLSDAELGEISDYKKIIRLHDEVIAGRHPRIKVPPQLAGKPLSQAAPPFASTLAVPAPISAKLRPVITSDPPPQAEESVKPSGRSSDLHPSFQSKGVPSRIDPVLLTKSDDLVRAEIKLQRERIERALREQLDQKSKESRRKVHAADAVPEFDVAEVLSKALSNLKPLAATEAHGSANTTDSVDTNSFYSSQNNDSSAGTGDEAVNHNVEQAKSVEAHNEGSRSIFRPLPHEVDQPVNPPPAIIREGRAPSLGQENQPPQRLSGLHGHAQPNPVALPREEPQSNPDAFESRGGLTATTASEHDSNGLRRNDNHDRLEVPRSEERNRRQKVGSPSSGSFEQSQRQNLSESHSTPDVPVIQNHIRSPIAPQPARVSPLAVARLPAAGLEARTLELSITRQLSPHQSLESPEHDSRLLHPPKRRRVVATNEKSRKEPLRTVADSPEPYIKREPTSPSSFATSEDHHETYQPATRRLDLGQGHRRDDQGRNNPLGLYSSVPHDHPSRHERYGLNTPSTAHIPSSFHHENAYRAHKHRADLHRYASIQLSRRPQSPPSQPLYSPAEGRPIRAVTQSLFERPTADVIHYYRDEGDPYRGQYIPSDRSRSPGPLRERLSSPSGPRTVMMAPPGHSQMGRIAVHENSRRYVEAPPGTIVRHSIQPASIHTADPGGRPREMEPYLEHLHGPVRMRETSFADREYAGHAASSPGFGMRRIVDHPDGRDFGVYRPREFSGRAGEVVLPREPYVYAREIRDPGPREHYEEVMVPRNFVQRIPSVRPEEVRYHVSPPENGPRMHSTHPDAGSGRSDYGPMGRLEAIPPTVPTYSVRAEDERRGYVPVQAGRYAYVPEPVSTSRSRYVDEVRYVERPREPSPGYPGEGVRRASYRY